MASRIFIAANQRKAFAKKLRDAIEASGKSNGELAVALGYHSDNIIAMFKSGKTRVPLAKVPMLAQTLDLEPHAMLREWFATFEPDALPVIEAHFGKLA